MTSEFILADGRERLFRLIKSSDSLSPADQALIAWLSPDDFSDPCSKSKIERLTNSIANCHYQDLAVLGYHWECALSLDKDFESKWTIASTRLFGTSPTTDGTLMPFTTDSVALLGLAIGMGRLKNSDLQITFRTWIQAIRDETMKLPCLPGWSVSILEIIAQLVNVQSQGVYRENLEFDFIRFALNSKLRVDDVPLTEADSRSILAKVRDQNLPSMTETIPSVFLMAAFDSIVKNAPTISVNHLSVDDVGKILRQFPYAFKRWCWEKNARTKRSNEPRKWHVDNEYHVQDLLYFLLRPIFTDLKDEEYFPSIGPKQPRADLYIPSLSLIIEVKFKYNRNSFSKLIEEIGADSALYLAGKSHYNRILVFVWDDSRQTEQHALFISGLKQIAGVVDGIVVSRPGIMEYPDSPK